MRSRQLMTLCLVGFLLTGCGANSSVEENKLRQSVKTVKRLVNPPDSSMTREARDILVQRIHEQGVLDGLIYTINASWNDTNGRPPIYPEKPEGSWCLVLKHGADSGHVILEGFGQDLTHPIFSEVLETIPWDPRQISQRTRSEEMLDPGPQEEEIQHAEGQELKTFSEVQEEIRRRNDSIGQEKAKAESDAFKMQALKEALEREKKDGGTQSGSITAKDNADSKDKDETLTESTLDRSTESSAQREAPPTKEPEPAKEETKSASEGTSTSSEISSESPIK